MPIRSAVETLLLEPLVEHRALNFKLRITNDLNLQSDKFLNNF